LGLRRLVWADFVGIAAPIVTGYVVAETGGYNSAFFVTGTLLLIGELFILTMTRWPIDKSNETTEQAGQIVSEA
jgi:ACS family glucarate transporter-like MFS transporter